MKPQITSAVLPFANQQLAIRLADQLDTTCNKITHTNLQPLASMTPEEEEYHLQTLSQAHATERSRIQATCDYLCHDWNTTVADVFSDPMSLTQSTFKVIFRLLLDRTESIVAYRDTLKEAAYVIETQEGIEMRNDMAELVRKDVAKEMNVYRDVLERLLWSVGVADGTVFARGQDVLERLKEISGGEGKGDALLKQKFGEMGMIYGVEL